MRRVFGSYGALFKSAALCVLMCHSASAEISLEVNQGLAGTIPIAVEARGSSSQQVQEIVKIIQKDLEYSEKIRLVGGPKRRTAEFIIQVSPSKSAYCMNISSSYRKNEQTGRPFCLSTNQSLRPIQLRAVAHQFADKAHKHITGNGNVFTHRIGFVKEISHSPKKKQYQIVVSDFDRHGEQVLLDSSAPIMSLTFSPNGQHLAYVSFEQGIARIFMQDVQTGHREVLASFSGVNSAPSWSPDGKKMAMALSFSGITKLYIMDIKTKELTKVTSGQSIDTEPYWTRDGKRLIFSSNRSGSPQIHTYDFKTKKIEQLTKYGQYNVAPQITDDGRYLVYLSRIDKKLQVVTQDLKTGDIRYLGNGNFDDTPRISPTNGLILYTTSTGVKTMLSIVSIDGSIKVPMRAAEASLKFPSWSPVARKGIN